MRLRSHGMEPRHVPVLLDIPIEAEERIERGKEDPEAEFVKRQRMDMPLMFLQGQEECREGREVLEGVEDLGHLSRGAEDNEALDETDRIGEAYGRH